MPISEDTSNSKHRIVLGIEYDGSCYSGWQKQKSPQQETVQQYLESALSKIVDRDVQVTCAGRTDAGVHASCQVIHFDSDVNRGNKAWIEGSNSLLPKTIRVLWASEQCENFHARFSALSRRYLYLLYQRNVESAMLFGRATHERSPLDIEKMHEGAQYLPGEQDFSSFRAAGCQSKTANRNIVHANIYQRGCFIIFDIKANAFLQHMVRNIVGSLLVVGKGEREPVWIAQLLAQKNRTLAAATASADGLYLSAVDYPAHYQLPTQLALPGLLLGV